MNRKQFGFLIVLLIVLGGAGWLLKGSHDRAATAGEEGTGQKLLGEFPINDVARIVITQNTNELHLEKKGDLWQVKERAEYPANFPQISELLIKLKDLKVIQNESIGASQLPRLHLALAGQGTNSGIVVEFKSQDGKTIRSLTLGKKHEKSSKQQPQSQFGDDNSANGRYVLLTDNPKNALLIGDALNELEPKPEGWLDKAFFKVERPKSIAVTYPSGTNSWKLSRDLETGEWKLADAKPDEKLDDARVSGVSSPFAAPTFNDVLATNTTSPDARGLDKPTVIIIQTFDDFAYTIKVGDKSGEVYPVTLAVTENAPKERIPAKDEKAEDKDKADKAWKVRQADLATKLNQAKQFEGHVYLVPSWTLDSILKERKDLLAEKKEEPKPEAPKN